MTGPLLPVDRTEGKDEIIGDQQFEATLNIIEMIID